MPPRGDANGVKFGTDGWRGVIARDFTFDNVGRVAVAVADYLRSPDRASARIYRDWKVEFRPADRGVIVGYDTRFLSEEFALHFARALRDRGVPVAVSETFVATPAVSYAVVNQRAAAGIMITSSHNPPEYNGLKIKSEYGGSATDEVTKGVEDRLPDTAPAVRDDLAIERVDLRTPYLKRVRELVDYERLTASKIHPIVDSMYGSAFGYVGELLREAGVAYTQVRGSRDVLFGGRKPEPLEENLIPLRAVMRSLASTRSRAGGRMIGVVTDGDGDRISAMDETGGFIDAHRTYALILRYLVEERKMRGPVVVSFNLSDLVRRMADAYGLETIETPVGFKFAAEHLLTHDALIAGEESGSIGMRGYLPERDGVLWSMILCEMLATSGKKASDLVASLHKTFGPQVYHRRDIDVERRAEVVETLKANPPDRFGGEAVRAVETLDGLKLRFADGWLLFRASGTEPILRMYCEMRTPKEVTKMLDQAETFARGV
ncbi:MAG: phosphoglucomutase/phosphomannomutase family protein [Candidatus Bipolaricaulota bacterium]|nr:phosphoglucomutase/phosphomannomutase family protein [Candidatus Bipolaricaulota bacterium]